MAARFLFLLKNMAYIKQKNIFSREKSHNNLCFLSITEAIGVFFALIVVFVIFPIGNVFASEITPDKVIELVNRDRLANKESVLVQSSVLTHVAQMKIDDMFEKNYFAHNSPEGKTPWVWFDKANYDYEYAGENLAIHFVEATAQQRAWMESPMHRKNILSPKYYEIGVAVRHGVLDGRETTVTVQEFGSQMGVIYNQEKSSDDASPVVNIPLEPVTISTSDKVIEAPLETGWAHRFYERVLMFLWIVVILQISIIGYMKFRSFGRRKSEDSLEFVIPVRVIEK